MRPVLKLGFVTGSMLMLFAALGSAVAVGFPPTIDRQWVTDVSGHDATLNAEINPNGLLTKYMLQIDTTGNFKFDQTDGCILHPPGVFCTQAVVPGDPLPPGLVAPQELTLDAGYDSQQVSVRMSSIGAVLQPGTTYHYRAIAANGPQIVEGSAQTFTTPSIEGPPDPIEEAPSEEEESDTLSPPSNEDPPSMEPEPGYQRSPATPPFALSHPAGDQEGSGRRRGGRKRVGGCVRKAQHRNRSHRRRGSHSRRHKAPQRKVCTWISGARVVPH